MRLRISLFELLLLVTPAFAVAFGLLVAALRSPEPIYVLTIAQSVYLVAMLAAVCARFHRSSGVRNFAGAFLAASVGHLMLVWLSNQSPYGNSFPTTAACTAIWNQAQPEQSMNGGPGGMITFGGNWIGSPPIYGGGSGFSGGMPGGTVFPIYPYPIANQRPLFVDVGIWAISLLLGVLCGVVARSLRGGELEPVKSDSL